MTVIELIRLLTGHSQSHAKTVRVKVLNDQLTVVDEGEITGICSEDDENFYLEVQS